MSKEDKAIEIGLRCKRFREGLGMSQSELADKLGTTSANISKYERSGISDIRWIMDISAALGQDLLVDETDEEGVVGEVGKEILVLLVENTGFIKYQNLKTKMFGMGDDRIAHEVKKLLGLGLCVREHFKDFYDKAQDVIFITAKGLITCQNIISNPITLQRIKDNIPQARSYEMFLKGDEEQNIPDASCYQEYIDFRPIERKIRHLPNTPYRINFILYLKEKFTTGIDKISIEDELYPHSSFAQDFWIRMAADITNDVLIGGCDGFGAEFIEEMAKEDKLYESIDAKLGYDFSGNLSLKNSFENESKKFMAESFAEIIGTSADYVEIIQEKREPHPELLTDEERQFIKDTEAERESYDLRSDSNLVKDRISLKYDEMKEKGITSTCPLDWFTLDEIMDFARTNYPNAKTYEESEINKQLEAIISAYPEVLSYYGKCSGLLEWSVPDELFEYIKGIYRLK